MTTATPSGVRPRHSRFAVGHPRRPAGTKSRDVHPATLPGPVLRPGVGTALQLCTDARPGDGAVLTPDSFGPTPAPNPWSYGRTRDWGVCVSEKQDEGELDLAGIEEICAAATPGPWFVRTLDDDRAMNLVAVSTVPDAGEGERWPTFSHEEIVAATLVQHPRYVDCADEHWDENAAFIAMAREAVPQLVAEVKRLRLLLTGDAQPDGE